MNRKNRIGKLSIFGVEALWQIPLLMPTRHESFVPGENPEIVDGFGDVPVGGKGILPVTIVSTPEKRRDNLVRYQMKDDFGNRLYASQFGYAKGIIDMAQPGKRFLAKIKMDEWSGNLAPSVQELIDISFLNNVRPVYPGSKVISPDTVRKRVHEMLDETIPLAVEKLKARIPDDWQAITGSKTDDLGLILEKVHRPDNGKQARRALEILEKLNALSALTEALQNRPVLPCEPMGLKKSDYEALLAKLPFELTESQRQSIDEIVSDLRRPTAMRRVLLGDVGTGKTITYLLPAALAALAGKKTAIMLPNIVLASQIHKEAAQFFGDRLNIVLVKGGGKKKDDNAIRAADIVVGTTALLHRDLERIDFMIVDEQQKFSTEQRQKLMDEKTHVLEVSATPIPRTQALVRFGGVDISMLRQGHADKTIHTKVRLADERRTLFEDIKKTVEQGHQVAVVYPLKHAEDEEDDPQAEEKAEKAAVKAFETWEKHFPGRVRLVHGDMKDEEKQQAVADMKEGRADILVSTSVIEVGVTIPKLMRLVVVDADRYGLSTLHQLRGRLARHGGTGYFDLFLSENKPESVERLKVLEKTNDGFEVAEGDLMMRGTGDLAGGKTQSGKLPGFLLGRVDVSYPALKAVAEKINIEFSKPEPIPFVDEGVRIVAKPSSEAPEKAIELSESQGNTITEEEQEKPSTDDTEALDKAIETEKTTSRSVSILGF